MAERISIVTDEISRDLEEVRDFLRRHDLRAVELRCVGDARVPDLSASDRETLRAWARARDPRVLGVSPGLFKCDVSDRAEVARQIADTLPRSIDLARDLGAAFLVTFAFENQANRALDAAAIDPLREAATMGASAWADRPIR